LQQNAVLLVDTGKLLCLDIVKKLRNSINIACTKLGL